MSVCIITGSGGLVGGESAAFFAEKGFSVVGIDNDMRSRFFGDAASTKWQTEQLRSRYRDYHAVDEDIRDEAAMDRVFSRHGRDIAVIVHAAAQPSHDWAANEPFTDFDINARATMVLLEAARKHCPDAVFIFTSTNKVYGDRPNFLPLVELETRWELTPEHPWHERGIDESMSLDACTHSLFGASKVAADIMVQEYGRYFGMNTVCFRGGCLTGSGHSGAQLHGFLSYLLRCSMNGHPYTVFGYKGKQVRDNIHSRDLVNMFWHYFQAPRPGEVYNAGGGRHSNCSILEAVELCEKVTGKRLQWSYEERNRTGDHIWWISDISKFREHYPQWDYTMNLQGIFEEIAEHIPQRSR